MEKFNPLRIGNVELVKNPHLDKKGLVDPKEKEKLLRDGEEFAEGNISSYIFGLYKYGISKNIIKKYGHPNITGINITLDFWGNRGKSLYIDEPIDIDLFISGESVPAYDSSGEEYEVSRENSDVLDWSEEEGNSLFVVRKIK
jgi:hypothetical protein